MKRKHQAEAVAFWKLRNRVKAGSKSFPHSARQLLFKVQAYDLRFYLSPEGIDWLTSVFPAPFPACVYPDLEERSVWCEWFVGKDTLFLEVNLETRTGLWYRFVGDPLPGEIQDWTEGIDLSKPEGFAWVANKVQGGSRANC